MTSYDQDFFQWTQETACAIEEGRFNEIDRAALADEVESLGKRDRREVGSSLTAILPHMLKTKYQPEMRSASWGSTLQTQRRELADVLDDSPSLRSQVAGLLPKAYRNARADAAVETERRVCTFPETCEWTVDEVLEGDTAR
jgi:hypothetical protein